MTDIALNSNCEALLIQELMEDKIPKEIILFEFYLSIGNIEDIFNYSKRENLYNNLEICPDYKNKYATALSAINRCKLSKEDIFIWYSDNPDDLCGLLFLLQIFSDKDMENIHLCRLAHTLITDEEEVPYFTAPLPFLKLHDMQEFREKAKPATKLMRQFACIKWAQLQKENAPLRAMVNNQIVSVPESFYDGFILKYTGTQYIENKQLIINLLLLEDLHVSDWFYQKRINILVEKGLLVVLEKGEKIYFKST